MAGILLFIILSVPILAISWDSLLHPRTHGFYRFFAFEAILALILINRGYWFSQPFSAFQILSWLLLLASIILAIHSFWLLRRIGRPQGRIENTTLLVASGTYRYIRHPRYASLLLFAAGAFLKHPSPAGIGLLVGIIALLIATAKVEEGENLKRFGTVYAEYMKNTRLMIPFLY
jgi:protein-S-isoprenylcysteine O-methyltransferase Ste14